MDRKDNNGSRASAAASIYKSLLEQGYHAWFSQARPRGMTIVWAKKTHPVLFARHRQPVLIMLDFCQQPNIFSWKYTFLPVLEELVYCQRFLSHVHSAIFIGFLLFRAKSPPFDFFLISKYHKSNVCHEANRYSQHPQPGLNMTPLKVIRLLFL